MAFPTPEAAVEVRAFARVGLESALDQPQGLIETDLQLRRDHIRAQGINRTIDALGQAEDEVTLMDLGGNGENIADRSHDDVVLVQLGVNLPAALWRECKSVHTHKLEKDVPYTGLDSFEV